MKSLSICAGIFWKMERARRRKGTPALAGRNQRLYDQKVRRSQPLRLIEGISAPDASPHRFKERDGRDFVDLAAEINNIHDLHSHIWDEWADEDGSIGKAYGYQLGVKHLYKEGLFDQVDRVIYDLKNNPFSRRILTNIYVHQDLHEMNLYPCAYSMTFNVTQKIGHDKLTLNAVLNQRSQDVLAANNWNVVQYSVLLHMLAQVCDMEVGELVHVIADAHIYDRHVPIIKELISRTPYPHTEILVKSGDQGFLSVHKKRRARRRLCDRGADQGHPDRNLTIKGEYA